MCLWVISKVGSPALRSTSSSNARWLLRIVIESVTSKLKVTLNLTRPKNELARRNVRVPSLKACGGSTNLSALSNCNARGRPGSRTAFRCKRCLEGPAGSPAGSAQRPTATGRLVRRVWRRRELGAGQGRR
eukprot:765180-Hanusia_phi.AAC.4